MPHFRKMFDAGEYLAAFDLDGREVTLEIESVTQGEVSDQSGKKTKKPSVGFVGAKKRLLANKTNCAIIVQLLGSPETDNWVGKRITLFPTTTMVGREVRECVRVKPVLPPAKAES